MYRRLAKLFLLFGPLKLYQGAEKKADGEEPCWERQFTIERGRGLGVPKGLRDRGFDSGPGWADRRFVHSQIARGWRARGVFYGVGGGSGGRFLWSGCGFRFDGDIRVSTEP